MYLTKKYETKELEERLEKQSKEKKQTEYLEYDSEKKMFTFYILEQKLYTRMINLINWPTSRI
jgi:hypothetical protein